MPLVTEYRGRRIREGMAKNGQRILYLSEDGKTFSLAFEYEEEKKHVLNALKFDIDQRERNKLNA
jgi:hypothetical protein